MEKIYLMTHQLRWSQHLSPVSLPRENKITSLFSYLEPHPYQNLVFKNSGMTKWNDQEYVIWSVVEWGRHCRTSKGKFFKSRIRGHAIWQITDWKKKRNGSPIEVLACIVLLLRFLDLLLLGCDLVTHTQLSFNQAHKVEFFQKASEALQSFLFRKFWTKRKVLFESPVWLPKLMIVIEIWN